MTEQLCPTCGCSVGGAGHEKGDALHCCQPCASGSACECGCCTAAEEEK